MEIFLLITYLFAWIFNVNSPIFRPLYAAVYGPSALWTSCQKEAQQRQKGLRMLQCLQYTASELGGVLQVHICFSLGGFTETINYVIK